MSKYLKKFQRKVLGGTKGGEHHLQNQSFALKKTKKQRANFLVRRTERDKRLRGIK